MIRQGEFPSGVYEICVKVVSASNNEELGIDCINQEVSESGLFTLLSPDNGQELDPKTPVVFTWSYSGKMSEIGYTFKIVEVFKGQTPEVAIKSNSSFFVKDKIKTSSFQYPVSAPKLEKDKNYIWMISRDNIKSEKLTVLSEWYTFSIKNQNIGNDQILYSSYTNCNRRDVDYWSIASELSRIYKCPLPVNTLIHNQIETLTLGYSQWLWSGDVDHIFDITGQNALRIQAKQWAIDQSPLCSNGSQKSIISIDYFTDFVTGPGGYFVGCHVTYGCSTGLYWQPN